MTRAKVLLRRLSSWFFQVHTIGHFVGFTVRRSRDPDHAHYILPAYKIWRLSP